MKENNTHLHISPTPCTHESRLFRETSSVIRYFRKVEKLCICGVIEGLKDQIVHLDGKREIRRIALRHKAKSKRPLRIRKPGLMYLEWFLKLLWKYGRKHISVVSCHHLTLLPVCVLLKWRHGAKLVYDAHELETEANGLKGKRKYIFKLIEKIFIKHADSVIVVGDAIADWYRKEYGINRPAVVLNCPQYQNLPRYDLLRQELGIAPGQKIFLYQGGLSPGRGIETILEAFAQLQDTKKVVVFMGYGELEVKIRGVANRTRTVYFQPAVPPSELLKYTASADYGICLIENVCLSYYLCLPNKLFEYMMAGLPVIVSDLPEMRRTIQEWGAGIVCPENTSKALLKAIHEISDRDWDRLSQEARIAARTFNWENQERVLFDVYWELGCR